MNLINLSGKYLNLDTVTSIEEPMSGDNIMYIHYLSGGRDSLIANSPEAAALRYWLSFKAVDIQAAYQAHLENQEQIAKTEAWQKRFLAFAEAKQIPTDVKTDEAGYYPRIPFEEYKWFLQGENDVTDWDEPNEETYAAFLEQQERDVPYRSIPF